MRSPRPRAAPPPRYPLHRLGRLPDPLGWPPLDRAGTNRFDDPEGQFRVLYAARERLACFAETLAGFRPSLELLATVRDVAGLVEEVPAGWLRRRATITFTLGAGRWLDLGHLETLAALRTSFGARAQDAYGLVDVDLSAVTGPARPFTRRIGRWAHELGFDGIAYPSRHGTPFECWAIFDRATVVPVGSPVPLALEDRDLQRIARVFGLRLPTTL